VRRYERERSSIALKRFPPTDPREWLNRARSNLALARAGADLFRAQAGTLTVNSKEKSRQLRARQKRDGKPTDAVYAEWTIRNYSFTLGSLKSPNEDERRVLSAIIMAAAETMPLPGDKIRAVGVSRGQLEPGRVALSAGMLPLEIPRQGPNLLAPPLSQGPG